jgi:hypothetical protein
MQSPLEVIMAGSKQHGQDTGLENLSVNSSRRTGVGEDGFRNPTHASEQYEAMGPKPDRHN